MRWDLVRLGMEARRRAVREEEFVSREEARVWVARCRATLIGATLSAKLRSSGEKEEER